MRRKKFDEFFPLFHSPVTVRPQLYLSLLLCCLASTAGAQSTNVSKRLITLKECVNLALDHNLDLQIRRLSTEIAGYRTKAAYGAYDPLLTLQAGRTYVDQPSRIDPKDSLPDNPYKLSVNSFGPSLSGVLPWGLTYNAFTLAENLDLDSSLLPNVLSPLRLHPENSRPAQLGAPTLARLGETQRAKEWLERTMFLDPDDPIVVYNAACTFAQLGEHDRAFDALERWSVDSGAEQESWLATDNDLESVRADPRFVALQQKLQQRRSVDT